VLLDDAHRKDLIRRSRYVLAGHVYLYHTHIP
jgi:hypothetical protein